MDAMASHPDAKSAHALRRVSTSGMEKYGAVVLQHFHWGLLYDLVTYSSALSSIITIE